MHSELVLSKNSISTQLEKLLLVMLFFCATLILLLTLYFSQRGFDFTDESFYITWIANPSKFSINIPISFFGFIYHPLFVMLEENLGSLRQANILITFSLAALLCAITIKQYWPHILKTNFSLLSYSTALASTSLLIFGLWLVTPNYNTLAFQALSLTYIGILLDGKNHRSYVYSGLIIGVGGWLTFMAKPSTAAILGLAVPLYWLLCGLWSWLRLAIAVITAGSLLLSSAILVDNTILVFSTRIHNSIELLRLLGSGQEFSKIFRIDRLYLSKVEIVVVAFAASFASIASILISRQKQRADFLVKLSFLSLLIIAALIIAVDLFALPVKPTIFFPIVFLYAACLITIFRKQYKLLAQRKHYVLAALLLATPHFYAFGSNGNYWSNGSLSAFFWVLACTVSLSPITAHQKTPALLTSITTLALLITAICMNNTINTPYRQPDSLRKNTSVISILGKDKTLVSDTSYVYLASIREQAEHAGFTKGTYALDLTGRSPGTLLALGAQSLGQPWMVGGYPGSNTLALTTLNNESCEALSSAWVLEEPKGKLKLSSEIILAHFGANRETDYKIVGTVDTVPYADIDSYQQNLLKPIRPIAIALNSCLEAMSQKKHTGEHQ